jgi:glycosyltransferase involved in cell wall biosynthesis
MNVSVVMPAYNSELFIAVAIESVLCQSPFPMEIIVVDDGSTDKTADIVKSYPNVICLRQENQGPSKARNTGIQRAKGDFVAFLDADDYWLPDKLSRQIGALSRCPDAGFSFATYWNFRDLGDQLISENPSYPGPLRDWLGHQSIDAESSFGNVYELLLRVNPVPTSSVIVRTDAFDRVGGFNESMRNAEDYECWLRLAKCFPALVLKRPVSRYRVIDTGLSGPRAARTEFYHQLTIGALQKHLTDFPTKLVRNALARECAGYAYYLLCVGRHEEAERMAVESFMWSYNFIASRIWLEARFPDAFEWFARLLGRGQAKA